MCEGGGRYNAFDPAGFVSVEPVALWIQAPSRGGCFGFQGITVLLLDHLVRRRFGTGTEGPARRALRRHARDRGRTAWYRELIAFLEENRHGERYLLATSTTRVAAPIIISTGQPVLAMGGCHGLDPILTPEELAEPVATNQVRFAIQGDLFLIDRRMGAETAAGPVRDWIRQHGILVDPTLWWAGAATDGEATAAARRQARALAGLELSDLKLGQEIVRLRPTLSR